MKNKKNKISFFKFFLKSLNGKKHNKRMLVDLNYFFIISSSAEIILKKLKVTAEELEFLKVLAFQAEGFYKIKNFNFNLNENLIFHLSSLGLILLKCKFKKEVALSDAGRFFLNLTASYIFENKIEPPEHNLTLAL